MKLNRAQAKALSTFFLDIAKGLILSAVGSLIVPVSFEFKILFVIFNILAAITSIKFALYLLERVK
jgi:hypothetical protein